MYLGAEMSNMINVDGQECWAMYSDKYCTAEVTNVEYVLEKRGLRLLKKCVTPLRCGYHPDMDMTGELNTDGYQWNQELIGTMRWSVENWYDRHPT